MKQDVPILVVIGNPPYNGFAGVNEGKEERALTDAYKRPKKVRRPEGQGLNDLYVRFFRMAERRIVQKLTIEKTDLLSDAMTFHYEDGGSGIVCFISNYSWLDGLSFTAMRERYLEAYDAIRIDCLNGDRYKTGKTTPDGKPDPSIFSTEHNREGIQVGTAIATLIRKEAHEPSTTVAFRDLWGVRKREELQATADVEPAVLYQSITPPMDLGLPFVTASVGVGYFDWPRLPDFMPTSFSGVKTARDEFLVDIDRDDLEARLDDYFNPKISNEEIRKRSPQAMLASDRFDPVSTRDALLKRGLLPENIIRYAYRPFDVRWLYWEPETKLLDEKRSEYRPHVAHGNSWITAAQALRKGSDESQYAVLTAIGSYHLIERASLFFPAYMNAGSRGGAADLRSNISPRLHHLQDHGSTGIDLFHHTAAVLNAPAYRLENSEALRMDWPRIPIPASSDQLQQSAKLGRQLAALLDPEISVSTVTTGTLRLGLRVLALPTKLGSATLDTALTAGWGYLQIDRKTGNRKTMAGQGLVAPRNYTPVERTALEAEAIAAGITLVELLALIGDGAVDVHLNAEACWSCVPVKVWDYTLGGYQVIKKWLSYREQGVLGRPLKIDEVSYGSRRDAIGIYVDRRLEVARAIPQGTGTLYDRARVVMML